MGDRELLDLLHARSESAVLSLSDTYGAYCRTIAFRVLQNDEDVQECLNDVYWKSAQFLRVIGDVDPAYVDVTPIEEYMRKKNRSFLSNGVPLPLVWRCWRDAGGISYSRKTTHLF